MTAAHAESAQRWWMVSGITAPAAIAPTVPTNVLPSALRATFDVLRDGPGRPYGDRARVRGTSRVTMMPTISQGPPDDRRPERSALITGSIIGVALDVYDQPATRGRLDRRPQRAS